jgi:hypothetical protein
MEERVHPHQEHGRDQTQADGDPGVRLDDRRHDPNADVRQHDACDLTQAAAAVDLEIGGEILLPVRAGDVGGVHGQALGCEGV